MATQDSTPASSTAIRRVIAASFVGNVIEWFDYAAYGYLATVLATVFFPPASSTAGLLATFGVFALSFLVRPLGGAIWGRLGDRLGRRVALSLSISIMSVATFLVGCLPGYASIGLAAPVLLLLVRLAQGLSAAGEYPGAATFLYEYAPPERRGRYSSVVPASTATGLLVGSVVVWALTSTLSEPAMHDWGWRVPFLVAAPMGVIGRYIRTRLEDTPQFRRQSAESPVVIPLRTMLATYRRQLLVACGVTCLNAVGFYMLLSYLPTYLSKTVGIDERAAFVTTTISLVGYVAVVLLIGRLSDRIGRFRMLLAAGVLFTLLSVPLFALMGAGGVVIAAVCQFALGVLLTLNDAVLPAYLAELFPTKVRYSGFGIAFNTANALFGGTAPFIATALLDGTGNDLAPAWYLAVAGAASAGSLLVYRALRGRRQASLGAVAASPLDAG